jgi:hypothetical protein
MEKREVFFEFRTLGDYTQVRAIDALTGVEISVTTPSNAARSDQMKLATNKLRFVLQKTGKD